MAPSRKLATLAGSMMLVAGAPLLDAAEVDVNHPPGGAGLWSEVAAWNPPVIPNNAGGDVYNVTIARPGGGTNPVVVLDLDVVIKDLTLNEAEVRSPDGESYDLTIGGAFNMLGATLSGPGMLRTEGTVNLNGLTLDDGRVCANVGAWSGGLLTLDNGSFTNEVGAVFNLTASKVESLNGGVFVNNGEFNATNRTVDGPFRNDGIVHGGSTFNGPGTHTGAFHASGGSLFFAGDTTFADSCTIEASILGFNSGHHQVGGAHTAGILQFSSGSTVIFTNPPGSPPSTISFAGGSATFDGGLPEAGEVKGSVGALSIAGNSLVSGSFDGINVLSGNGELTVQGVATLPATLGKGIIVEGGSSLRTMTFTNSATLTVPADATLSSTASFKDLDGNGSLAIDGTFELFSGFNGLTRINVPTVVSATGAINVRHRLELNDPVQLDGSILVPGPYGGLSLHGGGTVDGDIILAGNQSMSFGNEGAGPAAYTLTASSSLTSTGGVVAFAGGGAGSSTTTAGVEGIYNLEGAGSKTLVEGASVTLSNRTGEVKLGETVEVADGGELTVEAGESVTIEGDTLTVNTGSALKFRGRRPEDEFAAFFNLALFSDAEVTSAFVEGVSPRPMTVVDLEAQNNVSLQELLIRVTSNLDVAPAAEVELGARSTVTLESGATGTFGPGASVVGDGVFTARDAALDVNAPGESIPVPPFIVPPVDIRNLELVGARIKGLKQGFAQDRLNVGRLIVRSNVNITDLKLLVTNTFVDPRADVILRNSNVTLRQVDASLTNNDLTVHGGSLRMELGSSGTQPDIQDTTIYAESGESLFVKPGSEIELVSILMVAFGQAASGRVGMLPGGASTPCEISGNGRLDVDTATVSTGAGGGSQIAGTLDIAPGQSPGILSARGDFLLDAGSSFTIELGGTNQGTAYDFFDLSGSLSLSNVTLRLFFVDGFERTVSAHDVFTIVETDAEIVGSFQGAANGSRLATADGWGSFLVHYGAGSDYDSSAVVLSDFLPGASSPGPDLAAPRFGTNGVFGFTLDGTAGSNYVVEATEDLEHWLPIATNLAPPSGWWLFEDPETGSYSNRFYRARTR